VLALGFGGASAAPGAAATPTPSYTQAVIADSAAAYWRLGETSGTTAVDELGSSPGAYNNVSLNQAGTLTCDSNASASFDGTQSYVRVPSTSALNMSSAVTIELWAKRRTITTAYQVLVGKPGNGQSKLENYAVWLYNNRYQAFFGNGTSSVTVISSAVTDTKWHHVVATDDGSTVKIYLDGVLKASTATTLALTPNSNPLNIGRANNGAYFFNGWIDEVAVYPKALSATAVQSHYTNAFSDLLPPCFSLTSPANGSTVSDSTVTFSGTAGAAAGDSSTISLKIYSGETADGAPAQTLAASRQADNSYSVTATLADGTWTAQAQQNGSGGTTAFSAANTFRVGPPNPPAPTIDSGPPDPTNSRSATFSFADEQIGVTFQCALDAAAFAQCTSPQSYAGLSDGSHEFRVRAIDLLANQSPPAVASWTIDATPPTITLTAPANGDSRREWPTFTGVGGTAGGDASTVTVKVYSGPDPTGTALQTLTATIGTGGAYAVLASAPLDPGTYTARAEQSDSLGNAGASSANTFTVGDPVIFAAGSLASCNDSGARRVVGSVLSTEPDALLQTLGNHSYENGQPSDFACGYNQTYAAVKARTYPAVGNHDMYVTSEGPGGVGFHNAFDAQLAKLGPTASDPTKVYYSYQLGAWHIVVLNDTCLVSGSGGTPGCDEAAQEQWLRNDLATHPNDCVLGIANRPRWSSDNNQGRTDHGVYWDIFYKYGVDLVLAGAAHHYERFAPMDPSGNLDLTYGLRQIISGHGGYGSNPIFSLMPNSVVYDDTSYGALKLTLHAGSYDWQFMPVADNVDPGGGSFTDSGSGNCHAAPPPSLLQYHEQVLAASPAAYWRLGETSGTSAADETGANPGTYNNVLLGEPSALSSDSNPSASFSGAQSYVRVPGSPSLDMTSAVTVELWAKRRTISSTYQVLVGKPGNGQTKFENYAVWLAPSNRYTAYFGNGSTFVTVATPVVTDTNWHHIVATYNGSRAMIYMDGVLKQDIATTLQMAANTLPLNIGRSNSNTYFFNGWLDEVAVYPTALPAQTILAHYNQATGKP
jgi:Concanavalin A-like lectin/glucanases superfamily/Calcineurin-like phosphoesterase